MGRLRGSLGEAGADSNRGLDASKKGRAVDDDLEAPPLFGAAARSFIFDLGLLEDAGDLVADLSRLEESAVGQRRVVGSGRGEMPLLVGGVEAIAVSDDKDVGWSTAHDGSNSGSNDDGSWRRRKGLVFSKTKKR